MEIVFRGIIFILLASFIKCVVDNDYKVLYRRSRCEFCRKNLKFYELVPIFSYLFQRGRCTRCKSKIPFDIFLYEVFGVLVFLAYIFLINRTIFLNFSYFLNILLLIFIAIEDVKRYEINQKLLLFLILSSLFNITFSLETCIKVFIFTIFYNALYFLSKRKIGYGDIKLFIVLAFNLDVFENIYLFSFTFLYAGVFALFLIALKKVNLKSSVPLAPFIFLSYITVLAIREMILW